MMILVLGGGYIGSNLLDNFVKAGHQVAVACRSDVLFYRPKDVNYVNVKLSEFTKELLEKVIEDVKPDIIINCTGFKNVEECETKRVAALEANVVIVQRILDAIKAQEVAGKHIPTHFFHLSTDYVFAGSGGSMWKVTDQLRPTTFYGVTKVMAESIILKMSKLKTKTIIVRTGGIYGYKMALVESLIKSHNDKTPFYAYTNIQNSPISAQFLANSIIKMSKHIVNDAVVHASLAIPLTRFQLCMKFIKALNLTVELKSMLYAGKSIPFDLSISSKEYAEIPDFENPFSELVSHYREELSIPLPTPKEKPDDLAKSAHPLPCPTVT